MEDLKPIILFDVGNLLEQWKILPASEGRGFVWISIVEDAKLGIVDQHKKQHVYIFKKGAKVIQRFDHEEMLLSFSGLKKT